MGRNRRYPSSSDTNAWRMPLFQAVRISLNTVPVTGGTNVAPALESAMTPPGGTPSAFARSPFRSLITDAVGEWDTVVVEFS